MIKWSKSGKLRLSVLNKTEIETIVAYLQDVERMHTTVATKMRTVKPNDPYWKVAKPLLDYHNNCLSGIRQYLSNLRKTYAKISGEYLV